MTFYPIPEALSRTDVDEQDRPGWKIRSGRPARGEAHTSISEQCMTVPTADSELSRVIQAHEMMHAKVSPINGVDEDLIESIKQWNAARDVHTYIDEEIIRCAEEFRVNFLLMQAGFDITNMFDGGEGRTGAMLANAATVDAFNNAMMFSVTLIGTAGFEKFLYGVSKHRKEWVKPIKDLRKALARNGYGQPSDRRRYYQYGAYTVSDTTPAKPKEDEYDTPPAWEGKPLGFMVYTTEIINIINRMTDRSPAKPKDPLPEGISEELRKVLKESGEWGDGERKPIPGRVPGGGKWVPLKFDHSHKLTVSQKGRLSTRRKASVTGRRVGDVRRLYTDPQKRVFTTTKRQRGGVVLIDQSGSMSFTMEQLESIIEAAPGALVLGYSHGNDGKPNIWVHAMNGRRTAELHPGNGGNGCDGPALAFAIRSRKTHDPVVWVCDGGVTGRGDATHDELAQECANMVIANRVHMVENTEEAIQALRGPRTALLKPKLVDSLQWAARKTLKSLV